MLSPATRLIIFTAAFVASATAANPSAKAAGKFDGSWSAVLATKTGPCDATYRGAVQVINGIVQVEGAPNNVLSGRVSPSGSVTVRGALGANLYGIAWGRLSGNSGGDRWRVHMENDKCFGVLSVRPAISLIYPKRKGPAVECPLSAINGLMYCNRKSLSDHVVGAGEQRCRLQVSILGRSLNAIL